MYEMGSPPCVVWVLTASCALCSPPGISPLLSLLSLSPGSSCQNKDVKKLVPEELLGDDVMKGIMRTYNVQQFTQADVPGQDYKMIICKTGEVDASHYLDTRSGKVVGFDHLTGECDADDVADAAQWPMDDALEETRSALESAMGHYLTTQFVAMKDGTKKAAAQVYALGEGKLSIVISAKNVSLRNFWSGSFVSTYTVSVDADKCIVSGETKTWCHYFENGNVQMQQKRDYEATVVEASGAEDVAVNVVKHISECETAMQMGLEAMYTNMSDETFKDMRRVLPISGVTMDW